MSIMQLIFQLMTCIKDLGLMAFFRENPPNSEF